MTYEEHVARAMLLGGIFYPGYHAYCRPHMTVVDGKWLNADTCEPFEEGELMRRYLEWNTFRKNERPEGQFSAFSPRYFNWRKWT